MFRVIDPDQSHHMEMHEWIAFMMASSSDLELVTADASAIMQMANGEKGTDIGTYLGEGAELFLGETVGGVIGTTVSGVVGTLSIVGKGLDVVGIFGDEDEEAEKARRREAALADPNRVMGDARSAGDPNLRIQLRTGGLSPRPQGDTPNPVFDDDGNPITFEGERPS